MIKYTLTVTECPDGIKTDINIEEEKPTIVERLFDRIIRNKFNQEFLNKFAELFEPGFNPPIDISK